MRLKADRERSAVLRALVCPMKTAVRLCVLGIGALALSGCSLGILKPAGPIGDADKTILIDSVAIMLAIVLPTMAATVLFAWWFRASNTRARYLPNFTYSGQIEMVVWAIPMLVILLLGGVTWIGSHDLDPAKPIDSTRKPLEVEVVSLDWKWLFIYPQLGVASLNKLVVPVDVPLHLQLTSATVMNVFFVPQLGSMIYTMNGMSTQLYLQAKETGVLPGLSAHFSGDGFSGMRFDVDVLTADQFAQWTKTSAASATTLDSQSYRQLLPQSMNMPPQIYKLTDPKLFDAIVMQQLPPGDGPQEGRPNPSVSPRSGDKNVR